MHDRSHQHISRRHIDEEEEKLPDVRGASPQRSPTNNEDDPLDLEQSPVRFDPTSVIEDVKVDKSGTVASVIGEGRKGWVYLDKPHTIGETTEYKFKIESSPNMQI